jgi:acid phosphatase type 7
MTAKPWLSIVLCILSIFIFAGFNIPTLTQISPTELATPKLKKSAYTPITSPKIAAIGDITCPSNSVYFNGLNPQNCQMYKVRDLINNQKVSNVLGLGDLQYETGSLASYNNEFRAFEQPFGATFKPAIGNHEYGTAGGAGYFGYFGNRAGNNGEGWYSFDVGKWHIISLNSNCNLVGCTTTSPQYLWLQNDLNNSSRACTIAFWHHPRFSSGATHGNNTSVDDMYRLLVSKKVDILLQGHEHNYERFSKLDTNGMVATTGGIRSFVVGAGGKSLYGFGTIKTGSRIRDVSNFGALFLTLNATSYNWEYKTIDNLVVDSGADNCIN